MSSNIPGRDWHTRTLRAWQLAVLRFAVTLDNADRLSVLMIAAEIDRLGPNHTETGFSFFRKTSAELCAALLRPNALTSTILRQHLARIDDEHLRRIFAAAMEIDQPKAPSISKPVERDNGLWRGLTSRAGRPG